MRYRSFGDKLTSVSAITLRLDATRRKGQAADWRSFVFAALESVRRGRPVRVASLFRKIGFDFEES